MSKYDWTICNEADLAIYKRQRTALEQSVPGIILDKELVDVDNSRTAIYRKEGAKILVHNSKDVGCVYVESDIDLEPYFN